MRTRVALILAAAWTASLLGVGVWASGGRAHDSQTAVRMGDADGPILSGDDIGFQPVAAQPDRDGRVRGKLMVRVNGKWVEAVFEMTVIRTK